MTTSNLNLHCCGKPGLIRRWQIKRKLDKLKLNDSQKEKLDVLSTSLSSANRDHDNAKREVQAHIIAMMAEDGINREKTAGLIRTTVDQHADRATEIAVAFDEFYQGLEPWQRMQVQSIWRKHRCCASPRCC